MKEERQRESRNMLKKINVMTISRKKKKLLFVMCDEDDNGRNKGGFEALLIIMLSNKSNFEFKSNIQLDSIGAESEIHGSNQSSCSRLLVLPVALTLS